MLPRIIIIHVGTVWTKEILCYKHRSLYGSSSYSRYIKIPIKPFKLCKFSTFETRQSLSFNLVLRKLWMLTSGFYYIRWQPKANGNHFLLSIFSDRWNSWHNRFIAVQRNPMREIIRWSEETSIYRSRTDRQSSCNVPRRTDDVSLSRTFTSWYYDVISR